MNIHTKYGYFLAVEGCACYKNFRDQNLKKNLSENDVKQFESSKASSYVSKYLGIIARVINELEFIEGELEKELIRENDKIEKNLSFLNTLQEHTKLSDTNNLKPSLIEKKKGSLEINNDRSQIKCSELHFALRKMNTNKNILIKIALIWQLFNIAVELTSNNCFKNQNASHIFVSWYRQESFRSTELINSNFFRKPNLKNSHDVNGLGADSISISKNKKNSWPFEQAKKLLLSLPISQIGEKDLSVISSTVIKLIVLHEFDEAIQLFTLFFNRLSELYTLPKAVFGIIENILQLFESDFWNEEESLLEDKKIYLLSGEEGIKASYSKENINIGVEKDIRLVENVRKYQYQKYNKWRKAAAALYRRAYTLIGNGSVKYFEEEKEPIYIKTFYNLCLRIARVASGEVKSMISTKNAKRLSLGEKTKVVDEFLQFESQEEKDWEQKLFLCVAVASMSKPFMTWSELAETFFWIFESSDTFNKHFVTSLTIMDSKYLNYIKSKLIKTEKPKFSNSFTPSVLRESIPRSPSSLPKNIFSASFERTALCNNNFLTILFDINKEKSFNKIKTSISHSKEKDENFSAEYPLNFVNGSNYSTNYSSIINSCSAFSPEDMDNLKETCEENNIDALSITTSANSWWFYACIYIILGAIQCCEFSSSSSRNTPRHNYAIAEAVSSTESSADSVNRFMLVPFLLHHAARSIAVPRLLSKAEVVDELDSESEHSEEALEVCSDNSKDVSMISTGRGGQTPNDFQEQIRKGEVANMMEENDCTSNACTAADCSQKGIEAFSHQLKQLGSKKFSSESESSTLSNNEEASSSGLIVLVLLQSAVHMSSLLLPIVGRWHFKTQLAVGQLKNDVISFIVNDIAVDYAKVLLEYMNDEFSYGLFCPGEPLEWHTAKIGLTISAIQSRVCLKCLKDEGKICDACIKKGLDYKLCHSFTGNDRKDSDSDNSSTSDSELGREETLYEADSLFNINLVLRAGLYKQALVYLAYAPLHNPTEGVMPLLSAIVRLALGNNATLALSVQKQGPHSKITNETGDRAALVQQGDGRASLKMTAQEALVLNSFIEELVDYIVPMFSVYDLRLTSEKRSKLISRSELEASEQRENINDFIAPRLRSLVARSVTLSTYGPFGTTASALFFTLDVFILALVQLVRECGIKALLNACGLSSALSRAYDYGYLGSAGPYLLLSAVYAADERRSHTPKDASPSSFISAMLERDRREILTAILIPAVNHTLFVKDENEFEAIARVIAERGIRLSEEESTSPETDVKKLKGQLANILKLTHNV